MFVCEGRTKVVRTWANTILLIAISNESTRSTKDKKEEVKGEEQAHDWANGRVDAAQTTAALPTLSERAKQAKLNPVN